MASDLHPSSEHNTIDLSGLPDPVVRSIRQLVESLRKGLPTPEPHAAESRRPPLRGRFVALGLSVPKEDLDEARRDAWKSFPRDLPGPGRS